MNVPFPTSKLMSFSTCLRMTRAILGPTARVWRDGERVMIGLPGPTRYIFGIGPDFYAAFADAFAGENSEVSPSENQNPEISGDQNAP